MKHIPLILICTMMLSGCCLFRDKWIGTPTPVENLKPKRVPIQIANDLMLHVLSKVFYNERKTYSLTCEAVPDGSVELAEVVTILKRKLYSQDHIRPGTGASTHRLEVTVLPAGENSVALFQIKKSDGRVIWKHREPLKARDIL